MRCQVLIILNLEEERSDETWVKESFNKVAYTIYKSEYTLLCKLKSFTTLIARGIHFRQF